MRMPPIPVVVTTPSSVRRSRNGRRRSLVHRSTFSWDTTARRPTGPASSVGGMPGHDAHPLGAHDEAVDDEAGHGVGGELDLDQVDLAAQQSGGRDLEPRPQRPAERRLRDGVEEGDEQVLGRVVDAEFLGRGQARGLRPGCRRRVDGAQRPLMVRRPDRSRSDPRPAVRCVVSWRRGDERRWGWAPHSRRWCAAPRSRRPRSRTRGARGRSRGTGSASRTTAHSLRRLGLAASPGLWPLGDLGEEQVGLARRTRRPPSSSVPAQFPSRDDVGAHALSPGSSVPEAS